MKKINLKDYYAHISIDTYIDISDEVFNIFEEHRKAEQAYQSHIRSSKSMLTNIHTIVISKLNEVILQNTAYLQQLFKDAWRTRITYFSTFDNNATLST